MSTTMCSCVPLPMGSRSSRALTKNDTRRPWTAVTSASPVAVAPAGVGARCFGQMLGLNDQREPPGGADGDVPHYIAVVTPSVG